MKLRMWVNIAGLNVIGCQDRAIGAVPKECAVELVLKETDAMGLWVEMDGIIVLMIQLKVKDIY